MPQETNLDPIAPASKRLSKRSKAAIVVQLILSEGQDIGLSSLPENLQIDLTHELGMLRTVDRDTLLSVASEFADELESVALTAPDGVDAAFAAIKERLSPAAASKLQSDRENLRPVDPWLHIAGLSVTELVPLFETESIEICAVALSKLPVPLSAEVLGAIDGPRARKITYAMSMTTDIRPDTVTRIGNALATSYCNPPAVAFQQPPSDRVGAILNQSGATLRDALLEGLGGDDPEFADAVRKSIFTFTDIPARLTATDIPKVVREVDGAVLVTALAAATSAGGEECATAEYILSNMSQRMADQLREEMSERAKIKKADAEAAQAQVVAALRGKVDAGEIALIEPDEDEN